MSIYAIKSIPPDYLIYKIGIMKKSLFIILAVSFISLLFSKEFSFGFIVGGLISLANFSLLFKYILKMRDLSPAKAKKFIITKFLVIYLIMGITLFIAITKGIYSFAGVALGLLTIKLAIFMDGVLGRYVKPS